MPPHTAEFRLEQLPDATFWVLHLASKFKFGALVADMTRPQVLRASIRSFDLLRAAYE